jgi:prevent-host-death family protein
MIEVNVHEAKTHLSRLLTRVEGGEEVVIARAGTPVARLVPYAEALGERIPGQAKGLVELSKDFDDALPDDVLDAFES